MSFLNFNGAFLPAGQTLFTAQNRGFRYGDGLFETIKVYQNRIMLADYHLDRLFQGLRLLQMHLPEKTDGKELLHQIIELCSRNNGAHLARVRLAVYREESDVAHYVMETFPLLPEVNQLNKKGWSIDIYPHARKSCDAFANLKSANYLPFVVADLFAKEKGIDDSIVLNSQNNICETSKANIFLVLDNEIYTPALHQGCVHGVMRRYLIDTLKEKGIPVHQREVDEALLLKADEVFVTNAIQGMRWIRNFRDKEYECRFVEQMYRQTLAPLLHMASG